MHSISAYNIKIAASEKEDKLVRFKNLAKKDIKNMILCFGIFPLTTQSNECFSFG